MNSKIQVKESQKIGNGMFAFENLQSGTIIMNKQQQDFIKFEDACTHKYFNKFQEQLLDKRTSFSIFLGYISNLTQLDQCEQRIKKYLHKLPKQYHNLICWDNQSLKELEDKELIIYIKNKQYKIRKYYQQSIKVLCRNQYEEVYEQFLNFQKKEEQVSLTIQKRGRRNMSENIINRYKKEKQQWQKFIQEIINVSFQQTLKYYAIIQSRNVHFTTCQDSNSEVGALIPQLDMFNHSRNPNCIAEIKGLSYQIKSLRKIVKGEELFLDYGDFAPQHFMEYYGMNDVLTIPLNKDKQNNYSLKYERKKSKLNKTKEIRSQLALNYNRIIKLAKLEQSQ